MRTASEDAQERLDSTIAGLPIVGRKSGSTRTLPAPLDGAIRRVMPDIYARLTPDLQRKILDELSQDGMDASTAEIIAAIARLRKNPGKDETTRVTVSRVVDPPPAKVTLTAIIQRVIGPDPHVKFTPELKQKAVELAKAWGKKTTIASLGQTLSVMRKAPPAPQSDPPAKTESPVRGKKRYASPRRTAARKARSDTRAAERGSSACETFKDLMSRLSACVEQILNENDELRATVARIRQATEVH